MSSTSTQHDIQRFFTRGGFPATVGLMVAYGVTSFLLYAGVSPLQYLLFDTAAFPAFFWTPFTWPLVGSSPHPLHLLFALGWAYLFGGSVERSWGTREYLRFLITASVGTAVLIWLGSLLTGQRAVLGGLWVAMAPVVVVWSVINRREVINFWFLPIPGPVWALIAAGIAYFDAGGRIIGLFALPACAAAYWFASQGKYGGGLSSPRFGGTPRRDPDLSARFRNFDPESTGDGRRRGGFDPLKWWRDRQERKRLEKIFRNSGFGDDPDDRRRR